MPTLQSQIQTAELSPNIRLTCPHCGDEEPYFNSRTTIILGRKIEWVEIFVCSDSHVFMVPLRGARGPRAEVSPLGFELRAVVSKRRNALGATVSRTRELVCQSRAVRQQILATLTAIAERRTGRPCGLPIQ